MSWVEPPFSAVTDVVSRALAEDLGVFGDITAALVPSEATVAAILRSRAPGVLAGRACATEAFRRVDPTTEAEWVLGDGDVLAAGSVIGRVSGRLASVLTAERTALNFLCHLSGIATATASVVAAVRGHDTRIVCTRKTMPGLRALQKYAVRAGGGSNHRFGLDDAVLIKDNHIAIIGGIRPAIERARMAVGHLVKIEVEVDDLAQIDEVLAAGADAVLLDNMSPETMARGVAMIAGRALTEASGGITPATAPAIAAAGVDLISIGWLTHSVGVLDIGLDHRAG